MAYAISEGTRLEWRSYDDSTVVNIAITMDRVQGMFNDAREINQEIDQRMRTAIRGPPAVKLASTGCRRAGPSRRLLPPRILPASFETASTWADGTFDRSLMTAQVMLYPAEMAPTAVAVAAVAPPRQGRQEPAGPPASVRVKLAGRQVKNEAAGQGLRQAANRGKAGSAIKAGAPIMDALWDAIEETR